MSRQSDWVRFANVVQDDDLDEAERATILHGGGSLRECMPTLAPGFGSFTRADPDVHGEVVARSVLSCIYYLGGYRLGSDGDWRSWEAMAAASRRGGRGCLLTE